MPTGCSTPWSGCSSPGSLVVSSFGIREGLLYDELPSDQRALDPLIEATREAGAGLGRFAQHGDLIDAWIAPAFDDSPSQARLRLAACMLADIAWTAHPDFRAERGIDMALHGNWVAIDAPGRVMLAQALFSSFGGGRELPYPAIAALCGPGELKRAATWGFAMRLAPAAQRRRRRRPQAQPAAPRRRCASARSGGQATRPCSARRSNAA